MDINSIPRRLRAALAALAVALPLAGCYGLQAARGQAALLWKRRPVVAVIADPATPPAVRAQLAAVAGMRDFASRELGLPDNGSYRGYADVGHGDVVWNVFAAPEFSVEPLRWCFPVVGCVAYRGYFAERDANAFAARLRARGLDVVVRGAAAYSTLGVFDDPLLSTMLGWSDADLAGIMFHELTHQLVYVPGDASFSEALATLVEREGVRRWLLAQGRQHDLDAYLERQRRHAEVTAILLRGRSDLQSLYASAADPAAMRERKRAVFGRMRREYLALRAGEAPNAALEAWFDAVPNNAQLVPVATYEECLPGLARELEALGGDLAAFYRRARALAELPATQRAARVCGGAPDR